MVRIVTASILLGFAAPLFAQATPASLKPPPPALQLFERDWVLMHWALKGFDMNRDILLQPDEASAAAQAFRKLADADRDGRVTPEEYQKARQTILMGG
jgi:Spy/CpxP family protein refolding chaperone